MPLALAKAGESNLIVLPINQLPDRFVAVPVLSAVEGLLAMTS